MDMEMMMVHSCGGGDIVVVVKMVDMLQYGKGSGDMIVEMLLERWI